MGTLTIGVSGSGIVNGSKSYTVSDADTQKWVNYLIATATKGGSVPSAQQALVAWANSVVAGQITQTQQFARAQQIKAITVPPIVFT